MKKLILPRNQNVYKITHRRAGNARLQEKTRRHSTLYAITAHLLTPSSSTSSSLPRFAGSAQRQRRSRAQGQVPLSLSSSLPWCAHSLRARDFFPLSARFTRSPSLDFSFFLSLLLFAPFFRRCSRPREISLYSLSLSLSVSSRRSLALRCAVLPRNYIFLCSFDRWLNFIGIASRVAVLRVGFEFRVAGIYVAVNCF